MSKQYQIYGIGAALVDMEFAVDDSFLRKHGIDKGHMTLVDEPRLEQLLADLTLAPKRASGGSAANSIYAAQAMGARTFYSCKVAGDDTGAYFINALNHIGVATNPHPNDLPGITGRCLVLVTPDAERSMNTFLGISASLSTAEVNRDALAAAELLYIEGYLASSETGRAAAMACHEQAGELGLATCMTLSDPAMVQHFRGELTAMLGNGVTHLFCNEEEALTWAKTDRLDLAVTELQDISRNLYVTLGAKGSLVVTPTTQAEVPGFAVKAIDTNGAGDIYAGACMYGWFAGMPPAVAARLGNFAASRLVTQYGARLPQPTDYRSLLKDFQRLPS